MKLSTKSLCRCLLHLVLKFLVPDRLMQGHNLVTDQEVFELLHNLSKWGLLAQIGSQTKFWVSNANIKGIRETLLSTSLAIHGHPLKVGEMARFKCQRLNSLPGLACLSDQDEYQCEMGMVMVTKQQKFLRWQRRNSCENEADFSQGEGILGLHWGCGWITLLLPLACLAVVDCTGGSGWFRWSVVVNVLGGPRWVSWL